MHIGAIQIDDERYVLGKQSGYKIIEDFKYFDQLKKLNIFVGANNSGKSQFIRSIILNNSVIDFTVLKIFRKIESLQNIKTNDHLEKILNHIKMACKSQCNSSKNGVAELQTSREYYDQIFWNGQKQNTQKIISPDRRTVREIPDLSRKILQLSELEKEKLQKSLEEVTLYKDSFADDFEKSPFFVYIPILRGLRQLDFPIDSKERTDLQMLRDVYLERTIKDYEDGIFENYNVIENAKRDYIIFSGLSIYKRIKGMLLGEYEEREKIRDFEIFLEKEFFNEQITIIPKLESDNIYIKIGEKKERDMSALGDGIQSIIINTFPLFEYGDKKLVLLIEEPEMTMHPSMQRTLIETYLNSEYAKNVQVFLTTHSNHFLDLAYDYEDDVSIFSFEEKIEDDNKQKFEITNVTDNRRVLDLLGVRNSSVFLSNCVIWVEGVTDRMFIRKLISLDSRFSKWKEDKHYTFAEYAGSNLPNFDFIQEKRNGNEVLVNAFSSNNFLIADHDGKLINGKDFTTDGKGKRLKRLKTVLKNKFFCDYYEVENLIPFSVWESVIEKSAISSKKERLKDITPLLEKKFNDKLPITRIGSLIKETFFNEKSSAIKYPKYYDNKDIRCISSDETKKTVMNKVLEVMDNNKLLTAELKKNPQVKKLLNSLNKFIENNN